MTEDEPCATHKCPGCRAEKERSDAKVVVEGRSIPLEHLRAVEKEWQDRYIIQ